MVRLQAAQMFAQDASPVQVAHRLRVSAKSVGLLLTMDDQRVPVTAIQALNSLYTGWRWLPLATASPHWRRSAPQSAPRKDLLVRNLVRRARRSLTYSIFEPRI